MVERIDRRPLAPPVTAWTARNLPQGAVVSIGVADLRRNPDHAAELGSQGLFGDSFRIVGVSSDHRWYEVVGEDGYRSWLRTSSAATGDSQAVDAWRASAQHRVDEPWIWLGDRTPGPLPFGSRVARDRGSWLGPLGLLDVPPGAAARIRPRGAPPAENRPLPREGVLETAQRFLGVPYFWGGTTPAGLDCSGLLQLVFRAHEVVLPRDARDQFEALGGGESLRPLSEPPAEADILVFGPSLDGVNHIALAASRGRLLHAYGQVGWGSLVSESQLFIPELLDRFLGWVPAPLAGLAPGVLERISGGAGGGAGVST